MGENTNYFQVNYKMFNEDHLLIKRCKDHDHKVPDEENDPIFSVHLPSIIMRGKDKEDNCRKQGEGGVDYA